MTRKMPASQALPRRWRVFCKHSYASLGYKGQHGIKKYDMKIFKNSNHISTVPPHTSFPLLNTPFPHLNPIE